MSVECCCASRRSCTTPPNTGQSTLHSTSDPLRAATTVIERVYRVKKLKVTKVVDTDSQAVLYLHCSTTREGSDADLAEQIARRNAGNLRTLAADKGYDKQALREVLRELKIRPLIKHCVFAPYDHAHNARIDQERYNQRSMTETINSAVKRSLGFAVRARTRFREF